MFITDFISYGRDTLQAIYDTANAQNQDKPEDSSIKSLLERAAKASSVYEELSSINIVGEADQQIPYFDELTKIRYRRDGRNYSTDYKIGHLMGAADAIFTEFVIVTGGDRESYGIKDKIDYVIKGGGSSEVIEGYNEVVGRYNIEIKIQLLEERLKGYYRERLQEEVSNIVGNVQEKAEDVSRIVDRNLETVEALKEQTGFVSLFRSFNEYAEEVKRKLRPLKLELVFIKLGMLIIPMISLLTSHIWGAGWTSYAGAAALMLVLAFFFRINVKRQDQYEQIISKIENKAAISIFHENQTANIEGEQREEANREFFKFVYAPIETNEWSVPDIAEGMSKIVREFKGR